MSSLSVQSNASLAATSLTTGSTSQLAAKRDGSESKPTAAEDKTRQGNRTGELSPAAQRRVSELKRIDAEVRAHEQAHISAGRGVITSGPNYTYTYGPDGRRYAVAGEVGIDTSPEREPQANIDKGVRIQAAALAPAEPSPQDYRVAAAGQQLETRGRTELLAAQREARQSSTGDEDRRLTAYAETAPAQSGASIDIYA